MPFHWGTKVRSGDPERFGLLAKPVTTRHRVCLCHVQEIAVSSAADLPRSRVIQSTEDVQKRRFARTRWPKQDHQLAGEPIEIDARQGVDLDLTIAGSW